MQLHRKAWLLSLPPCRGFTFLQEANTDSSDKIRQVFSVWLVSEGVDKDLETNSRICQNVLNMKTQFMDSVTL